MTMTSPTLIPAMAIRPFGGKIICLLSIFVAGMGLATEFSNSSYLFSYFRTLREIEAILVEETLEKKAS